MAFWRWKQINPIDGADLANAIAEAIKEERSQFDVGGPETLTQRELAERAFTALGMQPKITFLPDFIRKLALFLLPKLTPCSIHGPAEFFLTVLAMDMVGETLGHKTVAKHFSEIV